MKVVASCEVNQCKIFYKRDIIQLYYTYLQKDLASVYKKKFVCTSIQRVSVSSQHFLISQKGVRCPVLLLYNIDSKMTKVYHYYHELFTRTGSTIEPILDKQPYKVLSQFYKGGNNLNYFSFCNQKVSKPASKREVLSSIPHTKTKTKIKYQIQN